MEKILKWRIGALILSFVALFTAIAPYLADWNETHIYNPRWMPHAKFHNAQTMAFGALLGVLTLYYLWIRRNGNERGNFNTAILLAGLYWLAQALAFLFPGVAPYDPKFAGYSGSILFGIIPGQIALDIVVSILLIVAYVFEQFRLKRSGAEKPTDSPSV